MKKLDNVVKSIQSDKKNAEKVLGAFINEVDAMVKSGRLTSDQAEELINAAEDLIKNTNSSK